MLFASFLQLLYYVTFTCALELSCSIVHQLPIAIERKIFTPIHEERRNQDDHEEVCIIASANINGSHIGLTFPKYRSIELFHLTVPYFTPGLFLLLDKATLNLELRKGTVSELVYGFAQLENFKISDTGLNYFDIVQEYDTTLQTLIIHERLITVLPISIRYLSALKLLDLSACTLTTLDIGHLHGLHKLNVLNLADNQLALVEAPFDVDLPSLAMFDVQQNQLTHIERFPEMFPKLKFTRIMQNRWDCEWVSEVRDKIWTGNITVLGTDVKCGRRINNGGLCCSYSSHTRARLAIAKTVLTVLNELNSTSSGERNDEASAKPQLTLKVFENETVDGQVIAAEMENVGIFLQDPIGAE